MERGVFGGSEVDGLCLVCEFLAGCLSCETLALLVLFLALGVEGRLLVRAGDEAGVVFLRGLTLMDRGLSTGSTVILVLLCDGLRMTCVV